jgi:head-tail adaptor
MTAPFRKDEQVTIERRTTARDPDYGTEIEGAGGWEIVADHIWANVQDHLPSRGENTANGMVTGVTRTRLRIDIDDRITTAMRVTLHGKGDRVMQIIAGPAQLDDRRNAEWMLEGYSHG